MGLDAACLLASPLQGRRRIGEVLGEQTRELGRGTDVEEREKERWRLRVVGLGVGVDGVVYSIPKISHGVGLTTAVGPAVACIHVVSCPLCGIVSRRCAIAQSPVT